MQISKHSLDVFEGEEHDMIIDGEVVTQTYAWVFFYSQENLIRHFKTFDTYKDAYSFMLKIVFSANANGVVTLDEKHWGVFSEEIAC